MVPILIIIAIGAYICDLPYISIACISILFLLFENRINKLEEELHPTKKTVAGDSDQKSIKVYKSSIVFDKLKEWKKRHSSFAILKIIIAVILGIVLLVGIALLFKHFAHYFSLPIVYLLIGTFIIGLTLLIIGWNIYPKLERTGIILQSIGLITMYLTIFAAYYYHLLIPISDILLLIMMVVLTTLLAFIQSAIALSLIALLSGFLVPIILFPNVASISSLLALVSIAILYIAKRRNNLYLKLTAVFILLISTLLFINSFIHFKDWYVNGLIVVSANLICAWFFNRTAKSDLDLAISKLLFMMGCLGWFALNTQEITHYFKGSNEVIPLLVFFSTTSLVAWILQEYLSWKWLQYPAMFLIIAMFLISLVFGFANYNNVWVSLCWLYSFIVWYFILYRHDDYYENYLPALHFYSWLFLTFILCAISYYLVNTQQYGDTLEIINWMIIPILTLYLSIYGEKFSLWPFKRYPIIYKQKAASVILIYLLVAFIISNFVSGNIPFLPYIPLLNPLDFTIVLMLWGFGYWYRDNQTYANSIMGKHFYLFLIGLLSFIWVNSMLLRTFSYWLNIPYVFSNLWSSSTLQVCLTIYWSIIALAMIYIATRLTQRKLRFLGISLIFITLIKLVVIDMNSANAYLRLPQKETPHAEQKVKNHQDL